MAFKAIEFVIISSPAIKSRLPSLDISKAAEARDRISILPTELHLHILLYTINLVDIRCAIRAFTSLHGVYNANQKMLLENVFWSKLSTLNLVANLGWSKEEKKSQMNKHTKELM